MTTLEPSLFRVVILALLNFVVALPVAAFLRPIPSFNFLGATIISKIVPSSSVLSLILISVTYFSFFHVKKTFLFHN